MESIPINPQRLEGPWAQGWALDLHTLWSRLDETGRFDTKRSPIGESLYRLKYLNDESQIEILAQVAARFLSGQVGPYFAIDVIVPIPPSDLDRALQPVPAVAREIGKILGITVDETYLRKVKPTPNLKDIEDLRERLEILRGAFRVDQRYTGKVVLLFDDLYRSGATLAMAAGVVRWAGHVRAVLVLTLTKTRTRR